jgi:CheY-like chemotaxis protein
MENPTVENVPSDSPPTNRSFTHGPRRSRFVTSDDAKRVFAGRRALIIGDDVENAGRAFMSLTDAGALVRLVRRREQIPTYLDELLPDVVVIDCDGGPGGHAALVKQLRRDSRTAVAVIAGLAGNPSRGQRARLLAAGVDELLPKPVDSRTFAQQMLEKIGRLG